MMTPRFFFPPLTALMLFAALPSCGADQVIQPAQPPLQQHPLEHAAAEAGGADTAPVKKLDGQEPQVPPADDTAVVPDAVDPIGYVSQHEELGSLAPQPQENRGLSQAALQALLGPKAPQDDAPCTGPWGTTTFDCFRLGQDPTCGVLSEPMDEEVVEYNGCALPEFGRLGMVQDSERFVVEAVQTILEGNWCKKGGIELDAGEPLLQATLQCTSHFTAAVAGAPGQHDWTATCVNVRRMAEPKRPLGKSCHFGGKKTYVLWSADVRIMRPIYAFRAADPACGRKEPVQWRRVQERVYNTCRLPQFGREPTNVCGAPELPVWSAPGLRRSHLSAQLNAVSAEAVAQARCTTCDDLPWADDAQVASKWACLRHSFTEGAAQSEDIAARGRALFETVPSAQLQTHEARPFYSQSVGASADATQTDAGALEALAQRRLCQALLQAHVHPQRMLESFDACLACTTPQVPAEGDRYGRPPGAPDLAPALQLFGRYVRATREGVGSVDEPPAAAPRAALKLAQAWYAFALNHLTHIDAEELGRAQQRLQAYAGRAQAGAAHP